jgi:HAD superfamily hydrolase (TIGR01450 family)
MNPSLARIRHVVVDMDGTLYSGSKLFDVTLPFLDTLDSLGIGHTFLTNNTSRSRADYIAKLRHLGISATAGDIYTAADSTIDYLRDQHPDARRIALLGTPSLCEQFVQEGFVVDWNAPQAVVVGFDTTLDYARLCRTAWWISKDLPYLATHPDYVCPTNEPTVLVDCGSICACLEAATGRKPVVLGKPDPSILRLLAKRRGLDVCEMAVVGDRLYTDVELAQRAGALAVLVLSGEATAAEARTRQPPPDVVVKDVGEFGRALVEARVEGLQT